LNGIQHLSGISTFTRQQVKRLGVGRSAIFDTRKTIPGWRELEKYAVRCGGGKNHRMTLGESVLIKDNHLQLCRLAKTDWIGAIRRLRRTRPGLAIELEVQSARDFNEALVLKPDQVLLDNLKTAQLRTYVKRLRQHLPKVETEVSGGVQTDQLKGLNKLGIDRISMGRLTHSAPAFDCSLDITHVYDPR
jgi:nicotinate-nucleotide pyrophosphorylase (carboxylating)